MVKKDPFRSEKNEKTYIYKKKFFYFWSIIFISFFISFMIFLFFVNSPSFTIFEQVVPTEKKEIIPNELILALKNVSTKDYVYLSQHGYKHSPNISSKEIELGYQLLLDEGLNISYYTPPFESESNLNIPIPIFKSKLNLHELESELYNFYTYYDEGYVNYAETEFNETELISKNEYEINYSINYTYKELTITEIENGTLLNQIGENYYLFKFFDYTRINKTVHENLTEIIVENETKYKRDKMATIHIQDDISEKWLEEFYYAEENISILRIDDINTNFIENYGVVDTLDKYRDTINYLSGGITTSKIQKNEVLIEDQVKRIYTAQKFCEDNNCTLVLAIIPLVKRDFYDLRSYKAVKISSIFTIMTIFPIYLFYILSFLLFKINKTSFYRKYEEEEEEETLASISEIENDKDEDKKISSSVIIPVYNESKFIYDLLKKNIKSFEESDLNIVEVIIINDGSQDNSLEEVKKFKKSYNGKLDIKIIKHDKNYGKTRAIRTGGENAIGDYILLTDSDSFFDTGSLTNIFSEVNEHCSLIGEIIPYETNLLSKMQSVEYCFDQKIVRSVQSTYNNPVSIPGPFCLIEKKFLNNVHFHNTIVDDFKIGLALNKFNKKIIVSKSQVYTHPPLKWSVLRRQRLRWYGGIIYESLWNRSVWKNNGFYMMNILLTLGSFMYLFFSLFIILIIFVYSINKWILLINLIMYFFLFNFIVSTIYLVFTKKWSLKLFMIFPYYMMFLFFVRAEAMFKIFLGHKFNWGTRDI